MCSDFVAFVSFIATGICFVNFFYEHSQSTLNIKLKRKLCSADPTSILGLLTHVFVLSTYFIVNFTMRGSRRQSSVKAGPSSETPQRAKTYLRKATEKVLRGECQKFTDDLEDSLTLPARSSGKGKGEGKRSKEAADSDVKTKLNEHHDDIALCVSQVLLPLITSQLEQMFQKCLESIVKTIHEERDQALAKAERSNLLLNLIGWNNTKGEKW